MIYAISAAAILFLLLTAKIGICVYVEINNFKINAKINLKLFGLFEIKLQNIKKESVSKAAADDAEEAKVGAEDVKRAGISVTKLVGDILKAVKESVTAEKLNTKILLALSDPMANGIAYGAASGAANVIYTIICANIKVKQKKLEVSADFNSGDGAKMNFEGEFSTRPAKLIKSILKHGGEIKKLIKSNGRDKHE